MGAFCVAFFEAEDFEFWGGRVRGEGMEDFGGKKRRARGGMGIGGERTAFYAGDEGVHDTFFAVLCVFVGVCACVYVCFYL